MISMNNPTCKICIYFENRQCHRYPPTERVESDGSLEDQTYSYSRYPDVNRDDWCGEYKEVNNDFG